MNRCANCGGYKFKGWRHVCPPLWYVWLDEEGYTQEDAKRMFAKYVEDAVKDFAAYWDGSLGDHPLMDGGELNVIAAPATEPDKRQRFRVRGEMVPEYWIESD